MDRKQLADLLAAVGSGACSVEDALGRLRGWPYEDLGFAKIDHHRGLRNGFPEVILGEGKAAEQVIAIAERLHDVGVAGIHRLLEHRERLWRAAVLIVVAGMEGALPSVVGGLVDRPVIAVPTSVGYGTSYGGLAALLGMLNTCAAGVVVVNIDNGFGAAAAAARMKRRTE